MKHQEAKKLTTSGFKRLCGVYPQTFALMVEIVQAHQNRKKVSGRPSKLTVEDQILMTLEYLREYRTYFHIAKDWGVNESTAFRVVRKVEDILIKLSSFKLPEKKKLLESEVEHKVIVIDVTESAIERPKKNQRRYYSGKKRNHTLKFQVVADQETGEILCTFFEQRKLGVSGFSPPRFSREGKKHDFKIFIFMQGENKKGNSMFS